MDQNAPSQINMIKFKELYKSIWLYDKKMSPKIVDNISLFWCLCDGSKKLRVINL